MTKSLAVLFCVLFMSAFACGKKEDKGKGPTKPTLHDPDDAAAKKKPPDVDKQGLRKLIEAAGACIKDEECIGPLHPCKPGCDVTYNPDKNAELAKILAAANKGIVCKQACARDAKTACVKNKCVIVK